MSTHKLTGIIVIKEIENKNRMSTIGFTLLCSKMAIMPLLPKTKMADIGKLIHLGNLLARKTMWLVLTTTSATSMLSPDFGAYCMTKISINTLIFQHTFSFHCNFQREHSLFISTNRINTLFLFFTFDFQQSTATKMYTLCNHSLPCYTLSVRLFPASNTEISSNHRKKQTVEILSQHT